MNSVARGELPRTFPELYSAKASSRASILECPGQSLVKTSAALRVAAGFEVSGVISHELECVPR